MSNIASTADFCKSQNQQTVPAVLKKKRSKYLLATDLMQYTQLKLGKSEQILNAYSKVYLNGKLFHYQSRSSGQLKQK